DAAGLGFLPGEIDAVDNGERGNDGNRPEDRPHAIEDSTDDEQNDALGALHEADFTEWNEGLGACARIADHDGAGSGDGGENDVGSSASHGIVDQETHVEGHVRVAVQRGIVEGAKSSDAVLAPRDLAIQHVQKSGKKIINAPVKNPPTAKKAAAIKFTTNPRNVRRLGLIPVAAITPTILSSSHLLPVPIPPVNVAISD